MSDRAMKDSGIEWIGEIPEHWEVARNSFLFKDVDKRGNSELPVLSVSIHDGVTIRDFSPDQRQNRMKDFNNYKICEEGWACFNRMRMWQGAVEISFTTCLVSLDYSTLKPIRDINVDLCVIQCYLSMM